MLEIHQIPQLSDNYAHILVCPETKDVAVVDPAQEKPVIQFLRELELPLRKILCTHHHGDHVGGVAGLIRHYKPEVYTSRIDQNRITGVTHAMEDGENMMVGTSQATVIFVPGHTRGHVAFHFDRDKVLFSGDTLFAGGCGRVFEGTFTEMYHSLTVKLGDIPDETLVYCGHEYTLHNLDFALTVEPENAELQKRYHKVKALRANNKSTVPSTMAEERATNPFLRSNSEEIFKQLKEFWPDLEFEGEAVFTATRKLKDTF